MAVTQLSRPRWLHVSRVGRQFVRRRLPGIVFILADGVPGPVGGLSHAIPGREGAGGATEGVMELSVTVQELAQGLTVDIPVAVGIIGAIHPNDLALGAVLGVLADTPARVSLNRLEGAVPGAQVTVVGHGTGWSRLGFLFALQGAPKAVMAGEGHVDELLLVVGIAVGGQYQAAGGFAPGLVDQVNQGFFTCTQGFCLVFQAQPGSGAYMPVGQQIALADPLRLPVRRSDRAHPTERVVATGTGRLAENPCG